MFALLQAITEWTAYTAFFPELEGKPLSKTENGSYLDRWWRALVNPRIETEDYPCW